MLVSWSWEWASCTIFSRAVVDKLAMDFFNSSVKNPIGKSIINKMRNDNLKSLSDVFNKSELDSIYTLWK